ncbi:MAG: S-methyl-5-thioribose-1-phosphate isomerase, partial [Candidatus Omnitrophota bacterium]
ALIRSGDTILTHCNTGALATVGVGTALGAVFRAKELGKKISVYATETRPLLQGARLTSWELQKKRIPATLVCDTVVGDLFRRKKVKKVFVGADRIAQNGDTANKIGTYTIASLAKMHRIPFYVVAPLSTFDFSIAGGRSIPIEERKGEEVSAPFGVRIAPRKTRIYNPAFDVTPAHLISAFVTDGGIVHPPYSKTLRKLRRRKCS